MSELKPCPFCGKEAHRTLYDFSDGTNITCNGECMPYITDEEWNTRPIEDALRAEIARRDEEVAELRKQKYIPVHDTLTDAGKEYYEKCIRQEKELARRDEIIARLKEYAERTASGHRALYRALMKELE